MQFWLAKKAALVCLAQEKLDRAAEHCGEALVLHRKAGPRSGEARTLTRLSDFQHAMGRCDDAFATLTNALELLQVIGDRNSEGDTQRSLAVVNRDLGHTDKAMHLASTAADLARDTGMTGGWRLAR